MQGAGAASGVFRNLEGGTLQVYIFKRFWHKILFYTNISTQLFHIQRGQAQSPLHKYALGAATQRQILGWPGRSVVRASE